LLLSALCIALWADHKNVKIHYEGLDLDGAVTR